ncbi:hypothetical protein MKD33_04905, partial [Chromobacterium piscinae]
MPTFSAIWRIAVTVCCTALPPSVASSDAFSAMASVVRELSLVWLTEAETCSIEAELCSTPAAEALAPCDNAMAVALICWAAQAMPSELFFTSAMMASSCRHICC